MQDSKPHKATMTALYLEDNPALDSEEDMIEAGRYLFDLLRKLEKLEQGCSVLVNSERLKLRLDNKPIADVRLPS